MQVSFVCSEHGLKGRGPEERLGRPAASSPSLGTRGHFRAVAMVARSLGQLSVQSLLSTGEASVMQPGMKYRNLGKSGLRVSCLGLGTWVTFGGQITDEGALGDNRKGECRSGANTQQLVSGGCLQSSARGRITPASASVVTSLSPVSVKSPTASVLLRRTPAPSSGPAEFIVHCILEEAVSCRQAASDPRPDCPPMAEQLMTLAYDNGINLFDTAEVYAAGKRSSLVITTKIFWGGKAETERGLSRKHIIEGLKASLERLQLEYVDVVFANRPDPNTPMEETVRAMTHVINQGMAMYWGTSRWSSMEIMEAYSVARQFNLIPPICEQAEYHMFQREKVEVQLPELFHKIGVGAMTWSPLACGIVSGKYDSGIPPYSRASLKGYQWLKDKILSEEGRRQQAKLKELQAIAERLGCTLPQLAIAWCLRNEGVSSVLLGASSADQLMENIGAIQVLPKLSSSIIHEIDSILGNKPYSKKDYRS
ncbi:hypothetical protein J1605_000706 [Eschrichtius robustus]|uniref:Voltage-gated potassium channel subunit beta-1 n=1 Tax=Eschrichtius robustus TaxID=9764 RepID=A0AB34GKU0_ESCRO|nr:hypothetical protein J1605_000706 [Eschrichtius robustus]